MGSIDTIPITTLVFDIDDTLYDVSTGFTAHRNNYGATSFMVHKLNLPSIEAAQELRDEYFQKYHSTAKALTVAEAEGKLPSNAPKFQTKDLSEWWYDKLDFTLLTKNDFQAHNEQLLELLQKCPLRIIAFSNGPRKYAIKVLKTLGLYQTIFFDDKIFAVDDVLPYCKPEKESFEHVFKSCGVIPNECVFIEDSMKNIRIGKSLGMKTILIAGMDRLSNNSKDTTTTTTEEMVESEKSKMGDMPILNDPTVDVVIETCLDMKGSMLGGIW